MIMIPEVEYLALLSLMKGDDPLKKEKALIDAKIHQSLTNKKISEDIKAKKYDWLLKQKRKLRELIEGKPQKVVVENLPAPAPNVPPYMGLNQNQTNNVELQKTPIRMGRKRRELKASERSASVPKIESETSGQDTSGSSSENNLSEYSSPKTVQKKKQTFQKTPSQPSSSAALQNESTRSPTSITPKTFTKLMNYVGKNKAKFGIAGDGSILTNFNKPVGGSNYVDTLKFMSGQLSSPPKGYTFLKAKLAKDPEFTKLFGQIGKGKKIVKSKSKKLVVVKFNPIKTPGLKRNKINTFKPKIWAKL